MKIGEVDIYFVEEPANQDTVNPKCVVLVSVAEKKGKTASTIFLFLRVSFWESGGQDCPPS